MYLPMAMLPSEKDAGKMACVFECASCGKAVAVEVGREQLARWLGRRGAVQDCFPDMPAAERELFISGTCGDCFKELFPPDDEDGDAPLEDNDEEDDGDEN